MSIFKVKQWWSNQKYQTETFDEGTQSSNCMKIDRFNSHSDSDCIIVGQGSVLKIYKPNHESDNSHSIIESQLNDVILQIETGKFMADCADRQILLLHSKSYHVYLLNMSSGHIHAGEQNTITPLIKHVFTRRALSTTCGPFGNSKRDLICIQALDGSLSFFDQDTFLFMCLFNDIILPGPVQYVPYSDQFIICKSTWVMEIFGFHQLREFSELSVRATKKNIPQWTYNAGEEITSIQVIRTSTSFSTIIAVGERHLYCFQDNGLMKYMIRFDYMPICFYAYLIGWYYEPNSRLIIMVASEDSKLNIYEGTSLLWSCDLIHRPISISRCYLNSLPGGIVTLSSDGILYVNYLGTEPDLNANGKLTIDLTDPNQIQEELDAIEDSLQRVMSIREIDDLDSDIDQIIKIKIDIGKPSDDPISNYPSNDMEGLQTCSMVVILNCENPKSIQSIQITYDCTHPITCSDTTFCLDNINGTEIIETQVYLANDADISDYDINVLITVVDNNGKIRIMSRRVLLPPTLYCLPVDYVMDHKFKLVIKTNQQCLDFMQIFNDFAKEELAKYITSENTISFEYRNSNKTVTVKIDESYTIEADEFSEMSPMLEYIVHTLKDFYKRIGIPDFKIDFLLNEELIKQILHAFLKSIEAHAKERNKIKLSELAGTKVSGRDDLITVGITSVTAEIISPVQSVTLVEELNVLYRQFTVVQKRLLVQYGSLPPGNCEPLEFLMYDTHERIKAVAYGIMQSKQYVSRAGNSLRKAGNIVIHILREKVNDAFKVKLIEEMLSLNTINPQFQEWEEAVAQGLSYILNKIFKKSEKDKEKLATVIDQDILSQTNLKKLLKQLRIIFEKLLSENQETETKGQITRIEEFVEVI